MALSSSEHTLLVETCTNMNVAANTCREVLEIVREAGSTGAVDIAVHGGASEAHSAATNLAQIDSDGKLHLGVKGAISDAAEWEGRYPYAVVPNSFGGYNTETTAETKGAASATYSADETFMALTNSSGGMLSLSALPSYFGTNLARYHQENHFVRSGDGTKCGGLSWCIGAQTAAADFAETSLKIQLASSTVVAMNALAIELSAIYPYETMTLGLPLRPFDTGYVSTAISVVSDRRAKTDVHPLGDEALDFVKELRPVGFKLTEGRTSVSEADESGNPVIMETAPGSRTHWGLIAQEVKEAMAQAGIEDAAVWCLADKNDPDSRQSLRYEELIAPLVKAVQVLAAKVEALEAR